MSSERNILLSQLKFDKVDPKNKEHAEVFIEWHKCIELNKLWVIHKKSVEAEEYNFTRFQKQFSYKNKEDFSFLIKSNQNYIGHYSLFVNHAACMFKEGKVAWPSIVIGNIENRNQGVGKVICEHLYKSALERNCTHIEAGIFEFNTRMIEILEALGFVKIGQREKLTFQEGKYWGAPHYLKKI